MEKIVTESNEPQNELDKADDEVKLAVDLLYLLEVNKIVPKIALNALKIVKRDLEAQLRDSQR